MASNADTVYERLKHSFGDLTRAERQLADSLLENWPVSGLGSITKVAKNADVSTPTVARMVHKLGFGGFPDFQEALRNELEEKISNPIVKHDRWATEAPDTHILNRFVEAILHNLRQTLARIDPAEFDQMCALLSDKERSIFVAGGRVTHSLATYFYQHMQMMRRDVTLVSSGDTTWPHYAMDLRKGDVLVILDIRRYQNNLVKLAEVARERGTEIVVFTDQWGSPAARHATHSFNCRIEVPSAWDSVATLLVLVETTIAHVQKSNWGSARQRMRELEKLFDATRLFRRFK